MAGLTDLAEMLTLLRVERRPGVFTLVTLDHPVPLGDGVAAVLSEAEGTTVVVEVEAAHRRGWEGTFTAAWLTLSIHSALEAVGLTAAVSDVLAREGIACNVLAGFHHDHLLVPVDRADEAVAAVEGLAEQGG